MDADRRAVAAPGSSQESRGDALREGAPPEGAMAGRDLLTVRGVSKQFGGTQALNDVGMRLNAGEIVALLGENGAGKSTLIKILAGVHSLDTGTVVFHGVDVTTTLRKLPIAFIHQDLGLVDWMTIAENIALAIGYPQGRGLIDWRAAETATASALALVNCPLDPTIRVRDLSRTEKSLVAIARALAVESDVLVLDEPSASLPADEVHRLFDALRPLKAHGVGMIYVSHRLDEVFEIADRIAVLRDGALVGERSVAETTPDELVSLIVGKALARFQGSPRARWPAAAPGGARARRRGRRPGRYCAFAQSEIVGLVGLRGAGHERIGRALFGSFPTRRRIRLDGQRLELVNAASAMAAGIGLIARDRVDESIASGLSIRENTFINPGAIGRKMLSLLSPRKEARQAVEIGAGVGLRPNAPDLPIEALSGGNQQKVVVGRWLASAGKRSSRRIRPRASMSAPRRRSTGCSMWRSNPALRRRRLHRFRGSGAPVHRALVFRAVRSSLS